jgi:hypothetical protein
VDVEGDIFYGGMVMERDGEVRYFEEGSGVHALNVCDVELVC